MRCRLRQQLSFNRLFGSFSHPGEARPGPPGWFVSVHPLGPPSVARKPIFTRSPPCRHAWRGGDQLFGMSFVTTQSLTCKSDNYFPGFLDHHFASPCQKAIKRSPSSQLFLAAVAESVFITETACQFVQQKEYAEKRQLNQTPTLSYVKLKIAPTF